jgi:hypothetical protein
MASHYVYADNADGVVIYDWSVQSDTTTTADHIFYFGTGTDSRLHLDPADEHLIDEIIEELTGG